MFRLIVKKPLSSEFSAADGALRTGQPFEAFTDSESRPGGVFVDMSGNEVRVTRANLAQIVANTRALLAERGDVGLPIDGREDHDHGDAYGWIKAIDLADNIVMLTPAWTELGVEIVSKKIKQYFSVTLDMQSMRIIGGSLTNWPAVGGLRPVELTEPAGGATMGFTDEQIATLKEMIATAVAEAMQAQMAKDAPAAKTEDVPAALTAPRALTEAEFTANVERAVNAKIAGIERRRELAEFATTAAARSTVSAVELSQALAALPVEQTDKWREIIAALTATSGANFSATGRNTRGTGKRTLPDNIAADLRAGKFTLARFAASPGMLAFLEAPLDEYDTAEFVTANGGK